MTAILIHMVLMLDLSGCQHAKAAIDQFLGEADLVKFQPTVDIQDKRCTIRYTLDGPETLIGLRQTLKHMATGLFSDATQAAIQSLKRRPDEFTVEMLVPPSAWRF